MVHIRKLGKQHKIILIVIIYAACIYLPSCSQTLQLPEDAQEALYSYWQSLPSSPRLQYHITRVWQGTRPADPYYAPEETWCVETKISASEDLKLVGERLTWIVFRENETTDWSAYMLMAMSSMWPYEACQNGR